MLGGNHSAGQNAGLAEAGAAMRSVAFWELPLVLGVSSVATAAHLADDGMPLPAVAVPALGGQTARAWARSVVAALAPLRDAEANESVAMTPVVQLDPCMGSDSLLRFSAFGAVLLGAQGLWWEGMGRCAPVGSAQFELVADINTHVSQWAEPLFMRKEEVQRGPWASEDADADFASAAGPAATLPAVPPFGPTDYVIDAAWSTSSLTLPPLRGAGGALVHAVAPGGSPSSVVQAMDAELIVVHFRNASADGKNGTGLCKSSKTVQGQDCITCKHDRLQATFLQNAFSTLPCCCRRQRAAGPVDGAEPRGGRRARAAAQRDAPPGRLDFAPDRAQRLPGLFYGLQPRVARPVRAAAATWRRGAGAELQPRAGPGHRGRQRLAPGLRRRVASGAGC